MRRRLVGGLALFIVAPLASAPGQSPVAADDSSGTLEGVVTGADQAGPVPYATVTVYPGGRSRFADDSGAFRLGHLPPGAYFVRARQIGYAPFDTTVVVPSGGATIQVRPTLHRVAILLPRVNIVATAPPPCTTPGVLAGADSTLADIFAQVRQNAERIEVLLDQYPFVYRLERWRVTRLANGKERTIELDTVAYDSRARRAYHPGAITFEDTDTRGRRRRVMRLPTFRDLADTAFIAAHCFSFAGEDAAGGRPTLRVDFRPAVSLRDADVEGSVYLDEREYLVRRAVFRLTRPERLDPPLIGLSVTTTFRQIAPSIVVFDEIRSVEPLIGGGAVETEELDRLVTYHFAGERPGAR